MAFLDMLQDGLRSAGDKASDVLETGKLKQKISSEQKEIRLELMKLGEIYLAQLRESEEIGEDEKNIIERIDAHKKTIDECNESLEALSIPKETL